MHRFLPSARITLLVLGALALVVAPRSVAQGPPPAQGARTDVGTSGQSATLLVDGRWLLVGGVGTEGLALIWDPATRAAGPTSGTPYTPRAWHTATMLPDGRVLLAGGFGPTGQAVAAPERFDPATGLFEPLSAAGLLPRARHTATLLTDGQVLIAGGMAADGTVIDTAELWDAGTEWVAAPAVVLQVPRHGHTAVLLPDGRVALEGGVDRTGARVSLREVFDPVAIGFAPLERSAPGYRLAQLVATIPADGATGVPLQTRLALRFSMPIAAESANSMTVALAGPARPVDVTRVPAEQGRLLFLAPTEPLAPETTYTLRVAGLWDERRRRVPPTLITFTTSVEEDREDRGPSADEDEWIPDPTDGARGWRTGLPDSPWQRLPPLQGPAGITALAGQVLRLNGGPLAGVTLAVEGRSTRTDRTGRFVLVLDGVSPGRRELLIDGRTAGSPGRTFGVFEVGVPISAGRTSVLPYTIWMPRLDTAFVVTMPSPTTDPVVITTPRIPGLELHLPPGTVIRDREGEIVREISITPIPVDRPPFPLPEIDVPVYFTIQPGGARVYTYGRTEVKGARLIYPNYKPERPGVIANFWHYDPQELAWYVYGPGQVMPDGRQVVPDPKVTFYRFTGAMMDTGQTPPPDAPPPDEDKPEAGDPVDLSTGLFILRKTDLVLPDVLPLTLTRTYRPGDNATRPFGIGATHHYAMFLWSAQQYQEADLILPDGARVHYVRVSPGTGYTNAEFEHTASPTLFYKSRITWNGNGWDLRLKDGTVYVFGENAPLQAIRDRHGNRVMLTWSATNSYGSGTGNIVQVTSPQGRWIRFTHDTSKRITLAEDNLGRVVSYTYDGDGRLWKVTDPMGGVTEYTYDAAHRLLTIKDARGIVFLTNEYDAAGRVIRQTQADETTYEFAYTLDGSGRVQEATVTNPRGHLERLTFNTSGYWLTRTEAAGTPDDRTTVVEREPGTQRLTAQIDALNRRTEFAYDSAGNLTQVTRLAGTPQAVSSSFTYEPTFHQVATATDPLNRTTSFTYDGAGNLIAVTDPLSQQITLSYNAAGQVVNATDPLTQTTQLEYQWGSLTALIDPLGRRLTRFVDAAGRVLASTDAAGQTTRYEYNPLNQITRVIDALGGETAFTYDPNGNLLSLTDARGSVTAYTYGLMDRLVTRTDPLERIETYTYDANGNLATVTDRKGQVTSYAYDALDRLVSATYADASTTSYTYDAADRLIQALDSLGGTITRSYDNLDRLTAETTPEGSLSYGYDAADRRTSMTVAGQPTVTYDYDDADRLTAVTQNSSGVSLASDPAGRRTSLTLPNEIAVEYAYDAASQLTGITYRLGAAVLGDLTYSYDLTGNRIAVGGTWARTGLPDPLTAATHDAANQLVSWDGVAVTHDANGNLTNDGARSYTWNARDQLVTIGGAATASFAYDGLGRRRAKMVGGATTGFLYDRLNPIQEQAGGQPSANLLTGLRIDEFFARTETAGARHYLTDALGGTVALVDAAGAVQTSYTYEPFGGTTRTGESTDNTFGFTGREDDGTSLYFYRVRYYDPRLHRFLSEDPVGFDAGDPNLYAYVFNNPTGFVDPLGQAVLYLPSCDPNNPASRKFVIPFLPSLRPLLGDPCDPTNLLPTVGPLALGVGPLAPRLLPRLMPPLPKVLHKPLAKVGLPPTKPGTRGRPQFYDPTTGRWLPDLT